MTIPELQEKVNNAQEKINKIEKTIEKHKKNKEKKINILLKFLKEHDKKDLTYEQLREDNNWKYLYYDIDKDLHNDFYWLCCDIADKESSIKSNEKKLDEAKQTLKNWQEKLRTEQVKLQYIQDAVPQVIKDFLLMWKQNVLDYYNNKKETYQIDAKAYKSKKNKAYFYEICENRDLLDNTHESKQFNPDFYDELLNYEYMIYYKYRNRCYNAKHLEEQFNSLYDSFFHNWRSKNYDEEWIDKILTEEMNNKLIDLMTRVSKITGEIVDASYLTIKNGNLNGYIIGKDGNADVETIGAGGYNDNIILDSGRKGQIFHYRTLIKPRK